MRLSLSDCYCVAKYYYPSVFIFLYLCNSDYEPFAATYSIHPAVGHLLANGDAVVASCTPRYCRCPRQLSAMCRPYRQSPSSPARLSLLQLYESAICRTAVVTTPCHPFRCREGLLFRHDMCRGPRPRGGHAPCAAAGLSESFLIVSSSQSSQTIVPGCAVAMECIIFNQRHKDTSENQSNSLSVSHVNH